LLVCREGLADVEATAEVGAEAAGLVAGLAEEGSAEAGWAEAGSEAAALVEAGLAEG
jgi:hypothetical protein